ncbi:MAG TPA: dipeptidase [Candidatus Krumholzibacteriaceae bacterium]|nr:dipeptidase [Candidatus Krumholzibacteriaceae bacterium]
MIELSKAQEERAMRLHMEAVVVDTHCDTLMQFLSQPHGMPPARSLGEKSDRGHIDLPRMIEGGVTCQTFAVYTGRRAFVPEATQVALQMVDKFYSEIEANDGIVAVTSHDEIVEAKKKGLVCGLLALEGAEPLMGEIALLRVFYRLGVRMLSFAWNYRTPFADGLGAKRAESKLPELGVQALEEMERLGMVFDVSHLADTVFWDVADVMKGPFIASHSNCRTLCDHPRNLTDDMIRALADHGGVMGMNFAPAFVDKDKATVEKMVDHVDHIVDLVGPDHAGLGSDYDGIGSTPEGLEDVSKMPNMTRAMVSRGYSDEDILKILGGNHLRVFKQVIG